MHEIKLIIKTVSQSGEVTKILNNVFSISRGVLIYGLFRLMKHFGRMAIGPYG